MSKIVGFLYVLHVHRMLTEMMMTIVRTLFSRGGGDKVSEKMGEGGIIIFL